MNPYHYTIEDTLGFITKNDQKNDQLIWNILNLYEKLHQKYLKLWWIIEIIGHLFCRSDLRIATKPFDSRESEFPPTFQNVSLIQKVTIIVLKRKCYFNEGQFHKRKEHISAIGESLSNTKLT